jgi:tRNA1(Val) A37 N6-methylase TrmN6
MPVEVTADAVLGGRLLLKQPRRGHRVGHDAILLAAACPARPRERVVDLGAGVGAAGLALAQRVDDSRVTLVEIDPDLAALAAENAQANGLAGRVSAVVLDVAAPARAFAAAGLAPESVTRVLMNPPFNDPARQRASPDRQRSLAHAGPDGTLFPIHSKAGEPAIRILVRAAKASRVPLALLPGLVLNDSAGVPTAQAESVLRGRAVLPLGQI